MAVSRGPSPAPVADAHAAADDEKRDASLLLDAGPGHDALAATPPEGDAAADAAAPQYASGAKLWLITFALCSVFFVVTLDMTVVATAVPVISDQFHSIKDIGWYTSVYFMAICISQPLVGKLNTHYPIKWTYSGAMLLFLVGSAVCGSAPNSVALIVGRAIAGLGCSGLMIGTFSLVPVLAPPLKRPLLIAIIGGTLGLGTAFGPLIGGAFTENVTWRWNFYLNLPIGAAGYAVFLIFVRTSKVNMDGLGSIRGVLSTLDLYGLVFIGPSVVCLLLALQWGGTKYAWDNGRIIALLVLFGVFFISFIAVELWRGDEAMLPTRVLKQRTVLATVLFCFCTSGSSFTLSYYIPIWFQATRGASPFQSGVDTLPLVLAQTLFSIAGGMLVPVVGYVPPFMFTATLCCSVGSGLFLTWGLGTPTHEWIGYQIIYGFGMGLSAQMGLICVQNAVADADAPLASSMVMFGQTIAGAIFTSVGQALFANNLVKRLDALGTTGYDPSTVLAGGITTLTQGLTGAAKRRVLEALNESFVHSWRLCVALSCIGFLGVLAVEWRPIKGKVAKPSKNKNDSESATASQEA